MYDYLRAQAYFRRTTQACYWRDHVDNHRRTTEYDTSIQMDRAHIVNNLHASLTDKTITSSSIESHYKSSPASYYKNKYKIFLSAGRSSCFAWFLYDRPMWCQFLASHLRAIKIAGLSFNDSDKITFLGSDDDAHTLPRVAKSFPKHSTKVIGLQGGVKNAFDQLMNYQPTIIFSYSSALAMLANFMLNKACSYKPRLVLTGTDELGDDDKELVYRVFGITPKTYYTTTETGMLASECVKGNLHLYEDLLDVDIKNNSLLVTNRINKVQKLQNYRLPGKFSIEKSCDCGYPGRVLKLLQTGRVIKPLNFGREYNGANQDVHPIVLRSALDPLGLNIMEQATVRNGKLSVVISGEFDKQTVTQRILNSIHRAGVYLDAEDILLESKF